MSNPTEFVRGNAMPMQPFSHVQRAGQIKDAKAPSFAETFFFVRCFISQRK